MCRLGGSSGSNVEKAACNWFQQHHITTASDHNRIRSQRHQITIPEPLAIGFNGIGPQRHQTTTASDHNGISSQIPERVQYQRLPSHLISLPLLLWFLPRGCSLLLKFNPPSIILFLQIVKVLQQILAYTCLLRAAQQVTFALPCDDLILQLLEFDPVNLCSKPIGSANPPPNTARKKQQW